MYTNKQIEGDAIALLAGVLSISEDKIERILPLLDDYKIIKKRKRTGKTRTLHVPHKEVRVLQRRLLRRFFYKLAFDTSCINENCTAFLPYSSISENADRHAHHHFRFYARIDLKDAFSSVSYNWLYKILLEIFTKEVSGYVRTYKLLLKAKRMREIFKDVYGDFNEKFKEFLYLTYYMTPKEAKECYDYLVETKDSLLEKYNYDSRYHLDNETIWREYYKKRPLFSSYRVPWFRRLIRREVLRGDTGQGSTQVIEAFTHLVCKICTIDSSIRQGPPTSPFLHTLALSRSGVIDAIQIHLAHNGHHARLSVYSDDFAITSDKRFSTECVQKIYELIEEKTCYKINKEKTLLIDRRGYAPVITGIRITETTGVKESQNVTVIGHKGRQTYATKEKSGWKTSHLAIPKKLRMKMRALYHKALTQEVRPELHATLSGWFGFILQVYKDPEKIPRSLYVPVMEYRKRYM